MPFRIAPNARSFAVKVSTQLVGSNGFTSLLISLPFSSIHAFSCSHRSSSAALIPPPSPFPSHAQPIRSITVWISTLQRVSSAAPIGSAQLLMVLQMAVRIAVSAASMSSAAFTITSRSGPANALSTVRIAAAMLSLIMPPANALKALPRLIRHAENTTMPAATGVMAPMANKPSMMPIVPITPAKASPAVRLASPLKAGVRINSAVANNRQAPAADTRFAETNPSPQHPAISTLSAAARLSTLFAISAKSTSASILMASAISIIAAPMATIATAAAVLSGARLPSRYSAPASSISIKLTPAMPAPPVSVSMALPICFTAAAITSSEALAITMLSAPFFIRRGFTFVFAISTSNAAMPLTTSPAPRIPSIMRSPRLAKIATAPAAISSAVPIALMATSIPPSFTRYLMILSRVLTSAFPARFCAAPAATRRTLIATAIALIAFTPFST